MRLPDECRSERISCSECGIGERDLENERSARIEDSLPLAPGTFN
jgi:hypothetical protein